MCGRLRDQRVQRRHEAEPAGELPRVVFVAHELSVKALALDVQLEAEVDCRLFHDATFRPLGPPGIEGTPNPPPLSWGRPP